MRRFLISYQYTIPAGFGFGSIFYTREDDALLRPADIRDARGAAAQQCGVDRSKVVVIAVSEVSPEGEVVT